MTVEEILEELATFDPDDPCVFPRVALQAAIEQQEAITPALLSIIERIANDPQWLEDNIEDMSFTYALYLLAQFREKRAYPLIVRYFGQLGTEFEAIDATEGIVTEDLKSILASVCHNDISLIKQLIENQEVNEFVRSAALQSLVVLYNNDQLSRKVLVEYFQTLIDIKLERQEFSIIWANVACCCCDIYPGELYDALVECFKRGLIDDSFITKKNLDYFMQMGKEHALTKLKANSQYQFINNVITEMENWYCFQAEKKTPSHLNIPKINDASLSYTAPKVGRNDPCPCGSGKKYKKCCLN
ncbi:MAG: DUF1186 domain-containing protein [Methylococcales bacterium]|nr:DUF1186 domain-containing protein [Methylococcales bacterium]